MRPLIYGHRGFAGRYPENTLASFDAAVLAGIDVLEMDVRMTSDGVIVVVHDEDGLRMCGTRALVHRSTLQEVQSWDAGHGFIDGDKTPFRDAGHRISTLEAVLERYPETLLNIDLKQSTPPMEAAFLQVVRAAGAESRVRAASFDPRITARLCTAGYVGPCALTSSEIRNLLLLPMFMLQRATYQGRRAQIPVRYGPIRLDSKRFIDKCHQLGVLVDYWVVNDIDEARRLRDLGADGLMTDWPDRLRDL